MSHRGLHLFGKPLGVIVVVVYKSVWGIMECLSGLLFVFSGRLVSGELVEDPQDLFANWLLDRAHFNPTAVAHVGALFLFLGAIKLLVAAGIWHTSWKMRRVLIVFLCLVTAYAAIEVAGHASLLRVFALVSDIAILVYLWKFLPAHLRHHGEFSV